MARARGPLMVVMSGAFGSACGLREGEPPAGPYADRLRALHARDAGGARRKSVQIRDGGSQARNVAGTTTDSRRIRVPCGDHRLRRECARPAPIGERRRVAPAQCTAAEHPSLAVANQLNDLVRGR